MLPQSAKGGSLMPKMSRILKVALSAAVLSGVLTTAHADGNGQVTIYYVGAGNALDNRQCLFFQTNSGHTWYAVPLSDPNYSLEASVVLYAFSSGSNLGFAVGGSACQTPQVYSLYLGTPS